MIMALSSLQLDAFLAVSKTLNFTKAAEGLHITQSALSQRILNLESELETALFIRDKGGLKLTEIGQELLKYCQFKNQFEDEFLSGLKRSDSRKISGFIRIGGLSSVMRSIFLPIVRDLQKQSDSLKLQMFTKENYELPELLKRNEVDYIIANRPLNREDVENILLGYEEYVLIQAKNYHGREIYLDHDENDEFTADYFKKFPKALKKPERFYVDDDYGILDAAKLGLGYSVLPKHLIESEKILEVVNPKQVLKFPVYLCFYRRPYYTRLHEALVQMTKDHFKERLAKD